MSAATQASFTAYMAMITALAVTLKFILDLWAQRRLRIINEALAAGTKAVAAQAEKAAVAVVEVKKELNISKEEVAAHRENEKAVFGTIEAKLDKANETADKTHTIVNSQRTAILQKLVDSQLFTLTLAKAMLEDKPHSQHLKVAVTKAQALYDASVRDLEIKQQEN